jgi:hypothetical protein
LNPHDVTITRSLVLLVCQFRHFRIFCFVGTVFLTTIESISNARQKVNTFFEIFYFIFFIFSVDNHVKLRYTNACVNQTRVYIECRSGGIGRRAGFRCLWSQDRVGSSPISCIFLFQKFQKEKHTSHCFFYTSEVCFSFSFLRKQVPDFSHRLLSSSLLHSP